ncbi:hypothetical protein D3C73_1065290 [compost metagenome]
MWIIYLNIDGVLNTDRAVRLQKNNNSENINFDLESMMNLKMFIEETDLYIVISPTWRIHCGTNNRLWTELIRNLRQYGT